MVGCPKECVCSHELSANSANTVTPNSRVRTENLINKLFFIFYRLYKEIFILLVHILYIIYPFLYFVKKVFKIATDLRYER